MQRVASVAIHQHMSSVSSVVHERLLNIASSGRCMNSVKMFGPDDSPTDSLWARGTKVAAPATPVAHRRRRCGMLTSFSLTSFRRFLRGGDAICGGSRSDLGFSMCCLSSLSSRKRRRFASPAKNSSTSSSALFSSAPSSSELF